MEIGKLSVRRKADREKLAAIFIEEMTKAGAKAEIVPDVGPREIWVRVEAPGGAYVTVDFDGDTPHPDPDTYVATWNVPPGMVFLNPDTLGRLSVNQSHYGKASRSGGFEGIVHVLKSDVKKFIDGSGYLPLDDPRIIAMGESYKAKGWTWPLKGRDE